MSWLGDRRRGQRDGVAFLWRDSSVGYGDLLARVDRFAAWIDELGVAPHDVVACTGDHSPDSCALVLALAARRCVIVPVPGAASDSLLELVRARWLLDPETLAFERRDAIADHPLLAELRTRGHPGLIVLSSGSTGGVKAAVHDFSRLLERYDQPRRALRVITFLMLDHLGGINTLLHTLANGGTVITIEDRAPDVVCAAIANHRAQLLPTSPTFLTMMLMADAHRRFDLSSLEVVTYGTEVMPGSTLARVAAALPHVRLQQTYGLTELGVFATRSRASDSPWMMVGGDGIETRVVDGELWIRSRFAMLGYLNAASPFDEDGWFCTHDKVAVDGDYLRILGRDSDIINVGGQKVYPVEVESVLVELPGVVDALAYAHPSPVTGHVVAARLVLAAPEDPAALRRRVREFCEPRLDRHKIPVKVDIVDRASIGDRYKRLRHG